MSLFKRTQPKPTTDPTDALIASTQRLLDAAARR